jgi:hypothetical protein
MKHIVKLTVSNPSHDFISMRSRIKQQDYITEARNESEAINRAARHFNALGFKVHSAVIVEQKVEIPEVNAEPVSLSEAVDYKTLEKPTVARVKSGETKLPPRTNYDIPPAMRKKVVDKKAALEAFIARRKETVTEETAPQYIEEKLTAADPASKWIHDFVHSDNPKFAGKSKEERIKMALGAKYASKRHSAGMAEEVEQIDEADIKSKPVMHQGEEIGETGIDSEASPGNGKWYAKHHKSGMDSLGFDSRKEAEAEVRAAHGIHEEVEQTDEARKMSRIEWRTGTPDDVAKNHQKIYKKLLSTDPEKAEKFLKSVKGMKKEVQTNEAADPGETKVVNKAVKTKKASAAADRIVKIAKSKVNKVNMDPELNHDVKQSSRY